MMSSPYQQLTLFTEAPRASRTVLQETAQEQTTLDTSGLLCIDWLIRQGHDASLSRMLGAALAQDFSTRWRVTWKVRATRSSRSYIQLFYSMRHTSATACSLWPTVKARDFRHAGNPQPDYNHSPDLEKVVCWATLRATANRTSRKAREIHGAPDSLCEQLGISSASYLNPEWAELFVGLPIGWTSLAFPAIKTGLSLITSRRGRSFVRVSIIKTGSRRLETS